MLVDEITNDFEGHREDTPRSKSLPTSGFRYPLGFRQLSAQPLILGFHFDGLRRCCRSVVLAVARTGAQRFTTGI